MRKALLLLVVLAGFVTGCEEKYKDPDPNAMGYGYYPLAVGDYRIYNVTDIKYKFNVGDTARFQMQERVDSSFYDQTNTLTYKIVRSVRPNENSVWVEDSVMTVSRTNSMVLLTKDNTKYVKLVFPVKNGDIWAGDAYNDHTTTSFEENRQVVNNQFKEPYRYQHKGEAYAVNGQSFDNTVTVVQGNTAYDFLHIDDRKEVYADAVGRIYRLFYRAVLEPCSDDQCKFGENFKLDGHERHEELVSYGTL